MSVNIQTSTGLRKISGENITSSKVFSAIGYMPAQASIMENHINNEEIHISNVERIAWNAKSDFSGDYNHLTGAPNIKEDESAILYIADKNGNIIAQIDENGVYTTDVILSKSKKSVLNAIHKLESLSYNDLKIKPNILEDESDNFIIADPSGNIILKADSNGLHTINTFLNGTNLNSKISEFNAHILNEVRHITSEERELWNAKSNFNGDYHSLINKPNILENNSDAFQITDENGNIAFQVDEEATHIGVLIVAGERYDTVIRSLEVLINENKAAIESNDSDIEILDNRLDILEPIVEKHTSVFAEDDSGVLKIVDNNGNIALQIDEIATRVDNLEANKINIAKELKVGNKDIVSEIKNVEDALNNYKLIVSNTYLPLQGGTITGGLTVNEDITAIGNIYGSKVYNAVWNDYAELFPKGEETEAGDIIALDVNSEEEKYIKAVKGHKAIIGVHSNEYGHLIGGEDCSIEENLKKYIPVGLAGRVWVKVHDDPELGDYITASDIPGVGEATTSRDAAIGIVVSKKQNGKVKIKII